MGEEGLGMRLASNITTDLIFLQGRSQAIWRVGSLCEKSGPSCV